MAKKMLIDATHNEEVRVAIVDGNRLEEFDSETSTKRQIKGNIYLAKVIRVEPSLQAAFVEFGGNRHGFLPFGEIHPDYFRIPVSDRNVNVIEIKPEKSGVLQNEPEKVGLSGAPEEVMESTLSSLDESGDSGIDLVDEDELPRHPRHYYQYKIQEVVKRRQIMLVQVVKEERGNKGAALTTYLSLPGRYCVLMPNAGHRGGGISRKINDGNDRRRLRDILKELELPEGMSMIVRTAGQERNRLEIRRDFDYLLRLWEDIRETTLKSTAPKLTYAEGDLIKRSIRDVYNQEIDQILVEGDETYKKAKAFMKALIPSHTKKVQPYKDTVPLFHRFKVEEQIDAMMNPMAKLPSGGSIVINPTEALVAIDVNSGKSTRERHIDETALKTNMEAAEEVARQMRLRDLAGLVVIDFIDMNDPKHIQAVEKRLKEATRHDRARIQIGRISQFGLLELSRQRLRPSLMETNSSPCHHCRGTGMVRSVESMSLFVLRAIDNEGIEGRNAEIVVTVPTGVDLYLLNQKRSSLAAIEARYDMRVIIARDDTLISPDFHIECLASREVPIRAPKLNPLPEPEKDEEKEQKPAQSHDQSQAEENEVGQGISQEAIPQGSSQGSPHGDGRHRRRRRQMFSKRRDRDRQGDHQGDHQAQGKQDEHHHQAGQPQEQPQEQPKEKLQERPEKKTQKASSVEKKIISELMSSENSHPKQRQGNKHEDHKPEGVPPSPAKSIPHGSPAPEVRSDQPHRRRRRRSGQRHSPKSEGEDTVTSRESMAIQQESSPLKAVPVKQPGKKDISVPMTALPEGLESALKKNSRSRWWKRLLES